MTTQNREQIVLIQRICLSCGEPERTPSAKLIYWRVQDRQSHARCLRCGGSLLQDEQTTFYVHHDMVEEEDDWPPKKRLGRPPKSPGWKRLEQERLTFREHHG